ncbi:MAG: TonB-dependent receptor [Pseudomonadota bacterium]
MKFVQPDIRLAPILLLLAQQTYGQVEPGGLEEVLIYGTKQDLGVQDTADSVEVLSAERLRDEVIFDIGTGISRTANTSVTNGNLNSISMRGISRNGPNNAGQGQAINVYIDGAPASTFSLFGNQSVWDVEQVEVLRGSQSTVQGRNSIAGAVVVRSKRPTYEWEGAARVRLAEYGTEQYSGAVSGPLIDQQLAFRLSADWQETDGYTTNGFTGEDSGFFETLDVRGRLLYEPDAVDGLTALFMVDYSDREQGDAGRIFLPVPANDPAFDDFDPLDGENFQFRDRRSTPESQRFITDIRYDLSDTLTLAFLATYEDVENEQVAELNQDSSFARLGSVAFTEEETFTAELRLEFSFERWSGLVGAYYFEFEQDQFITGAQKIGEFLPFPVDPIDSIYESRITRTQDTENYALFTQWRFEPNAKWAFDFGLRYDDESYEAQSKDASVSTSPDDCMSTVPGGLVGSPEPVVTIGCDILGEFFRPPDEPIQSDDFEAWLPRLNVTYNLTDDASLFAGVRRGYRAGGTFLSTSDSGVEFRVEAYDPEFLTTFDLGWRSQWLDRRLTVNGNFFYSEYDDQQVSIIDEDGFPVTSNVGKTSLYGLELSGDYAVTESLSFYGTLGLLETNIDEFIYNASTEPPIDLEGNELDRSPQVSTTVGVTYRGESGLFGTASLNYRSSAESDIFNLGPDELGDGLSEEIGSSYLLNGQLGYQFGRFTATLFVINALDEDEPEVINLAGPPRPGGEPSFARQPSFILRQPRTYGASLDAVF